jgi:hypothetical protein
MLFRFERWLAIGPAPSSPEKKRPCLNRGWRYAALADPCASGSPSPAHRERGWGEGAFLPFV